MKMFISAVSAVAFALLSATSARCYSAEPKATRPIEVPAGQRQLFLDDYGVASIDGLTSTMHQPTKKGAVIVPDQPWERWVQTRCAPGWDEKQQLFKIWMSTTPSSSAYEAANSGTTYAESKDGIHWTKPALRQQEYKGSLENNFVTVDPKLRWGANSIENVVCDPNDRDPSRRYKGFLGAEGRQPIASPDGIHWTRLNGPAIPSGDEANLSYDPLNRVFIGTFKTGGPHGRSHAIWTSKDFVKWTNLNSVFSADDEDQRLANTNIRGRLANPKLQQPVCNNPAVYNADIYNIAVFRYEGLYVGLPAVYHATGKDRAGSNTDGFHLIQLACSRDLRTWQRLGDRQPFIGPSPVGEGAYDLTQLLPAGAPLVQGDELWFYYTGLKYREEPLENVDPRQGAVCRAVLRRDGFISLDAAEKPGTLLTKPFVVRETKLFVNVDAAKGTLEVEVLDGHNKVVAVSKAVVGDQPRASMSWKSSDFADLKDKTVSLRFTLKKASLYSFWLDK